MLRLGHYGPRRVWAALLALLLLIPLAGAGGALAAPAAQTPPLPTKPVPDPHQSGVQWFAPTGHTLRGAFLRYWQQYGGLAQFGYPITEEFLETNANTDQPSLTVQYFQRARFEHH